MAIAGNITTVTLNGNYVDFAGNPIAGQIKFTLSEMLRNSLADQMVVPSTISVTLDTNGSFSVSLPSTDDPDMVPEFSYTVEEAFPKGRTYTITLPANTVGALNLADISPDPTLSEVYTGLIDSAVWNILKSNIDTLNSGVNQTQNTFPKSGEYWYIPAAYTSYTELNAAFASYSLLNAGSYPVNELDLVEEIAAADAARVSAAASASTVATITAGQLNALMLIGG